jgi:7-carboxy-7-deazaguanine synthase
MLRLSELYVSTQGEGQHVGRLTAFVRFAGCNMRCPGWPCDTPHAIEPSIWVHESEKLSVEDLVAKVIEETEENGCKHVCLTGGEPFLQDNRELAAFVQQLRNQYYSVEVFSNGSFQYPPWAIAKMDIMMDWKLKGSGEQTTDRAQRLINAKQLKHTDGIKYVVKDLDDFMEAMMLSVVLHNEHGVQATEWVGTAWDQISERELVDLIKEYGAPFRLNVQVHKYIWPATERGV